VIAACNQRNADSVDHEVFLGKSHRCMFTL